MEIRQDWLSALPEQFKGKYFLEVLIGAFADELQEAYGMFEDLRLLRSLDTAEGAQLDRIGDIVVLSRAQSALYAGIVDFDVIDDERYRLFLKYKAARNSNQCTYPELSAACRLLYRAQKVTYHEDPAYPATFFLGISAEFTDEILSLLQNTELTLKPGGVATEMAYYPLEFFGFGDTNKDAKGFGQAPFAHQNVRKGG